MNLEKITETMRFIKDGHRLVECLETSLAFNRQLLGSMKAFQKANMTNSSHDGLIEMLDEFLTDQPYVKPEESEEDKQNG